MERDWDVRGTELSAAAIAAGQPTEWFDQLYAEGERGEVSLPWDRTEPNPLLRTWMEREQPVAAGRRAVVVGCGLGADAEYLARLGFATTGFDVAPTAIRLARERNAGTEVDYHVADLLDLPPDWDQAFDLVVEIFTLQALPDPPRTAAAAGVRRLVAAGGTLVAIQFRREPGDDPADGPPFPLTRADLDLLTGDGLRLVAAEELDGSRWRATYRR